MGWNFILIFLSVALLLSAIGFKKFVYFLSIGYGFSVAGIGVTIAVISLFGIFNASIAHYIICVLLAIYGIRLSGFLLIREFKNASFRKTTVYNETLKETKMPFFVKFAIWISVAILYVAQTSPIYFVLLNESEASAITWIGIAVMILAIIIESVSDKQKSIQKAKRPDMVATEGLYKIVRCPNYFGEILFWTGLVISALTSLSGVGQWITVILGYICIVYIMFNGAQRLEKRQMERYGDNKEYKEYTDKTPIIIPLLPIYHLNKTK